VLWCPRLFISSNMQQDEQNKTIVEDNKSGGYSMQPLFGLDVNTQRWALGVLYAKPVKLNLAGGQTNERPGLNIHLGYSF